MCRKSRSVVKYWVVTEQELKFNQQGKGSQHLNDSDESIKLGNASELLVASLYGPRNEKLVKIDGNLIIHSSWFARKLWSLARLLIRTQLERLVLQFLEILV